MHVYIPLNRDLIIFPTFIAAGTFVCFLDDAYMYIYINIYIYINLLLGYL